LPSSTTNPFLPGPMRFAMMRPAKGTVNSSLTICASPRACANRRWCGSQCSRPQTRQGCFATNRRCCLSLSRFASGRASTLLSMRERGSSLAVGAGSFSAGARSSFGIAWSRASRAWKACPTLSPSSGVSVFAFGQARSVQTSRSSLSPALPARPAVGPVGLLRLHLKGRRSGLPWCPCEARGLLSADRFGIREGQGA
jgi:hypothetical protein